MDKKLLAIAGTSLILIIGAVALSQKEKIDFGEGDLAVISLSGAVSTGSSTGFGASEGISPSQVEKLNQQAVDQGADAILYEINSGGGAVVASKEVKREIESVDVPTVCRFRDIGASGAYLFALGCDSIIADSSTLTGSIGVRSSYFEFSGTLNKLGIDYVNITAGERKDIGSQYRNITDEEREILQMKADRVHEEFITMVDNERNLTESELETATTGEPFLGDRAEELSLVDRIGGQAVAVEEAERLTDRNLSTMEIQQQPSFNFLSLLTSDLGISNFVDQGSPIKATYR
jgi:protease-4